MNNRVNNCAPICFVAMDNLNRVPYIKTYASWIDGPYDVLYWDRSGLCESIGEFHSYIYKKHISAAADGSNKLKKLAGYIGFRKFAKRILLQNSYSLVFALTGNCAVLLSDVLLNEYPERFVIDIRDYWHEDFTPYHNREQECIQSSALAVISSPAYRQFLCEHDYCVMHNDQAISEEILSKWNMKNSATDPFVIACIGAMKNPEYDKKVIDYFANDERFELRFIGRGYEQLEAYCLQNSIMNVVTKGAFKMSKTMEQYEGTDAILNMYGNHSPYWDYALSNKLYYAARLGLPILVCEDTAMAEITEDYSFGIAIDLTRKEAKETILQLYKPEVREKRLKGIRSFLAQVEKDNARTKNAVQGLCSIIDIR